MPLTDRILNNGIHLLAEPIATTKAVAIGFWFSRGSRDENLGSYGITHFIEHMLFKGTNTYSASDLARFFDRIGGYVNACTERELMYVYCVVPSSYTQPAIELILDMLQDSLFTDSDIEKERTVIISEILSSRDDSEEMAGEIAFSSIYPNHGISRPIGGLVEDIEVLDCERLRSYYTAHFKKYPPIVTIAGNIDINSIITLLETVKGFDLHSIMSIDTIPPNWKSGRFYPESHFSQSQIFLFYPLKTDRTSSTWFSWSLINAIIGDTVSSRLFQSVREQKGLCYSLYSFFNYGRDSALWSAYIATPAEKTLEAVETLLSETESIRTNGLRDYEITDARSHLIGELLLSAEDTENRMKRIARQFFYNGKIATIEESIDLLTSCTDVTIAEQLRNSFQKTDESLLIYAEKKQLKECKKRWP